MLLGCLAPHELQFLLLLLQHHRLEVLDQSIKSRLVQALVIRPGARGHALVGNAHISRGPSAGQARQIVHLFCGGHRRGLAARRDWGRGFALGVAILWFLRLLRLAHHRNGRCSGGKGVLAARTVEAVRTTVLLVARLCGGNVFQAVGAEVRLDLMRHAEATAQLGAVAAEEQRVDRVQYAAGARVLNGLGCMKLILTTLVFSWFLSKFANLSSSCSNDDSCYIDKSMTRLYVVI